MASLKKMTAGQRSGIPQRIRLKKGDQVQVIAGRDKGKRGRIINILAETGRVTVEHCGMIKKHEKASGRSKGGIIERESPIHVSNVMLLTAKGETTRVGSKVEGEGKNTRRVRVARKTGEVLDKK